MDAIAPGRVRKRIVTPVLGALLIFLTALSVLGYSATPAWAQTSAKFGAGYVELIEDNMSTLCPDSSGSSGSDDDDDDEADEGTADSGLPEDECGLGNEKFDEAVEKCATEDKNKDADDLDKDKFLECMAKEGFGEEEEEETTPEETGVPDQSLGRLSASLTAFYVNSLAPSPDGGQIDEDEEASSETEVDPTKETGLEAWRSIMTQPGMAGGFVGAPDRNKSESSNWLFSAADANNVSRANYAAFGTHLSRSDGPAENNRPDAGVEGYLLYGAMLNGLGFDSAGDSDELFSAMAGGASGLIMMFAYFGAGSVDAIFDAVVGVLQWTNPFRFMVDAITAETNPEFTTGMRDGPEPPNGALDGIKEFFTDIYGIMVDIGWMVTIPLFLATTFAGMLLLRRFETGDKVKQLIIRIAFLVVGVPLLGVSYTAGLTAMQGASGEAASSHATKVVLSTYVDFEGWLGTSRLAPPTSAMSGGGGDPSALGEFWWNVENQAPNGPTAASARMLALNINADTREAWKMYASNDLQRAGDQHWGESMVQEGSADGGSGGTSPETFTTTVDMLNRFVRKETVSAGNFETSIKAGLSGLLEAHPELEPTMYKWTQDYTSPESLASMTASDVADMRNPLIQIQDGASFNAVPSRGQGVVHFTPGTSARDGCTNDRVVPVGWTPEGDADPRANCNMSPVAAYNYLNTEFGSSGMKMYSGSMNPSEWSRNAHASVSSVGAGPAKFMYWFSAVTMLVSFTIIGIAYAISMMISSLKRTVQLIGSVPFATMGFMGAIAKVVIYTAALFLELFGTIFIYKVVQELIVAIPSIFERPLAEAFAGNGSMSADQVAGAAGAAIGAASLAGEGNLGTLVLIITAVSSLGLILFTAMALKIRRSLLDGLDEAVTQLVNKFMGTQSSAGMAPGQPGAMRQGIARGAGMAVPAMVMSGGLGGGGGEASAELAGAEGGSGGDGSGPDGGGGGNPGAPGAGDGSMRVGENGGLTDAAGNPVVGGGGTQMTAMDMVPVDAYGNLAGGDGGAIIGEDGSPLAAGDVAGFDGQGRLIDDSGEVMRDANGNELMSNPASAAAGKLAGDKAVAAQALSRGLSGPGEGTRMLGSMGSTMAADKAQVQQVTPSTTVSAGGERVPGEVSGLDRAKQMGVIAAGQAAVSRFVGGRQQRSSELTKAPTSRPGGGGGGGGSAPAAPIPRPPRK